MRAGLERVAEVFAAYLVLMSVASQVLDVARRPLRLPRIDRLDLRTKIIDGIVPTRMTVDGSGGVHVEGSIDASRMGYRRR